MRTRFFLDDFSQIHQRNNAQGNQQIGPDRAGLEIDAANEKENGHTGETADQCADCPVQTDTECALDFRLDTDNRRDGRIERRPGPDIEKQINQAADENRNRCLDNNDSHIALVCGAVTAILAKSFSNSLDLCFCFANWRWQFAAFFITSSGTAG